ncbi:MAG: phosphotransferase family protein [Pirellulales bacterium]|nr:phosphotransferase family protein [Pirellulales bacterium]
MTTEFLDRTRPIRAGEELDTARLEAYLRARLELPSAPLTLEQFPAGHSNLTYCVRFGDEEFVLRRPPFGSKVKTAHDMGREYRVLSKLYAAYPPAPQPLVNCEDLDVIGAPFYVMRRIRGIILRRDPPRGLEISPEVARRMGEGFLDNLADLHALNYEAIGLADLGKPAGYVQRQVEGWIKRYGGSQTDDIPEVDFVSQWLAGHMPPERGSALIHNDYKYDNVVLDANDLSKVIGVLDWEMSTLGDPLMDLGTTVSYWIDPDDPDELQLIRWGPTTLPGSLTRRDLVDRYAARTGLAVDDMVFYLAFGFFKTAVIAQQIYYRYKHGLTQDERFAFFIEATKILVRAAQRAIETGRI